MSVDSFLCVNRPVPANILVAESWLRDEALQGVVTEFKRGYKVVITPGSTPPPNWAVHRYGTIARFAAASLASLGIDTNSIVAVPGETIARDRTFAAAVAVREWLKANSPSVRAINVYSMGPHARRTRLLYKRAFGDSVRVGIISHPDRSYNPRMWWTTMEGTREILSESLAYLYVKFFFWKR